MTKTPSRGDRGKSAADCKVGTTIEKPRASPPRSSKKRKHPSTVPREGVRKSARTAPKVEASSQQLLKCLLSKDAQNICCPEDEARDLETTKTLVSYTRSALSPFQELLCAVVLSRPISHKLGLRTIRTIFNSPYEFTSAQKIMDAGLETVHKALCAARTQHKAKTADQIYFLADLVLDRFSDDDDAQGEHLGQIMSMSNAREGLARLIKEVKGFGPTAGEIFRRRVQWLWEASYPFIDTKSAKALRALGLTDDADALADLIEQNWTHLKTDEIEGKDSAQRKKRALVIILERVIEADLEGKIDKVTEEASKL